MAESFAWRNKANSMKIWGLTDRGTVREQNQDTFHLWKEDNTAALLVDGDKSRQTVFRHDGVLDLSVQLRQRGPPGTVFAKQNNVADMIFA